MSSVIQSILLRGIIQPGGVAGGDITTGLVAWWKFDEGSGTTVNDSSGNANTATILGGASPAWVAGMIGTGAFSMPGADSYVQVPYTVTDAIASGSQFTMACWFKGTKMQSAIRFQTDFGDYAILGYSDPPVGLLSNDSTTVSISGVQDGSWHHVALTWQQNTTNGYKIYVDGSVSAQRNSVNTALSGFAHAFHPILGDYGGGLGTERMNGTLDDVRVYSRALSSDDITALYAYR